MYNTTGQQSDACYSLFQVIQVLSPITRAKAARLVLDIAEPSDYAGMMPARAGLNTS